MERRRRSGQSGEEREPGLAPDDETDDAFDRSAAWQALGYRAWKWRGQLRRSPVALQLFDLFGDPQRYRTLLGDDGYRDAVLASLRHASPADAEAAGMQADGHILDWIQDDCAIRLLYSQAHLHRAVSWREPAHDAAFVWVDGVRVTDPRFGDEAPARGYSAGQWVRERYFVMAVAATDDHPDQSRSVMTREPVVQGLLIWDATTGQVQGIEMPEPGEAWHVPVLHDAGHELRILASADRIRSGKPWSEIEPVRVLPY